VSNDREQLDSDDPAVIGKDATLEQLQRMSVAEDVAEKRFQRFRRKARIFSVSQALVGYVALAGFFANAYQNYNAKKQADARAQLDEERWAKEFKRAQDADKYRAFFETSALATDPTNPDKRLVGYALLKEFVDDPTYNAKATFMLEESLALELRTDKSSGLDEQHAAAVTAILGALSHTSDCAALERAAHSIDKLALHHAQKQDVDEAKDVLGMYVLRIVGRTAQVCKAPELIESRKPIRDFLSKQYDIAGFAKPPTMWQIDHRIAEILKERAADKAEGGVTEFEDIPQKLQKLCEAITKDKSMKDGLGLCTDAPPPPDPTPPKKDKKDVKKPDAGVQRDQPTPTHNP
jgi:hypothetical protein